MPAHLELLPWCELSFSCLLATDRLDCTFCVHNVGRICTIESALLVEWSVMWDSGKFTPTKKSDQVHSNCIVYGTIEIDNQY